MSNHYVAQPNNVILYVNYTLTKNSFILQKIMIAEII